MHDLQLPIIEAYQEALPAGTPPRVLASRTALVVDPVDRARADDLADAGVRRLAATFLGADADSLDIATLTRMTDTHIGTVDEVVASLAADKTLERATDISFQVHSIDAPHELTLRSLELLATEVAPQLGWAVGEQAGRDLQHAHLGTDQGGD